MGILSFDVVLIVHKLKTAWVLIKQAIPSLGRVSNRCFLTCVTLLSTEVNSSL